LPNRGLTLLTHGRREGRLRFLVIGDHRLQRVAHLLHLGARRLHLLVEGVFGLLPTGRPREHYLRVDVRDLWWGRRGRGLREGRDRGNGGENEREPGRATSQIHEDLQNLEHLSESEMKHPLWVRTPELIQTVETVRVVESERPERSDC